MDRITPYFLYFLKGMLMKGQNCTVFLGLFQGDVNERTVLSAIHVRRYRSRDGRLRVLHSTRL